jgi:hypothetical protein
MLEQPSTKFQAFRANCAECRHHTSFLKIADAIFMADTAKEERSSFSKKELPEENEKCCPL